MQPLILKFKERSTKKNLDYSLIEYCPNQNLSVIRNSQIPAINYVSLDTITNTRTDETSDTDDNLKYSLRNLMDTSTSTLVKNEVSDGDETNSDLKLILDTQTVTESVEGTDSDQ
jgi:hypothetical protein